MSEDEGQQLLKGLERLLARQIELARRGSFTELPRLADESEAIVAEIKKAGLLEKPQNQPQRQHLNKLYKDLQLMLSTEKDAAVEQLKLINRGRKTLDTYRENNYGF